MFCEEFHSLLILQYLLELSYSTYQELAKENSTIHFIQTASTILVETPWIEIVKEKVCLCVASYPGHTMHGQI